VQGATTLEGGVRITRGNVMHFRYAHDVDALNIPDRFTSFLIGILLSLLSAALFTVAVCFCLDESAYTMHAASRNVFTLTSLHSIRVKVTPSSEKLTSCEETLNR
jgi:hypothetical protein